MKIKNPSRRRFLQGLGLSAAAVPFVPLLTPDVEAGGEVAPKRLVIFYFSNGLLGGGFYPNGNDAAQWSMPYITEPLEPHKEDLVFVQGLQAHVVGIPGGHIGGMGSMLTGRRILDEPFNENGRPYGYASGPSIDQFLADELRGDAPIRSIEAGVDVDKFGGNKGLTQRRMIYSGSNEPVHPEGDPLELYARVFGEGTMSPDALDRLRARRGSVLEFVRGELQGAMPQIPAADRVKFEAHIDAVAELEQRLSGAVVSCDPSPLQDNITRFDRKGRAHLDILVQALACDATRVASIQWNAEGRSPGPATWLGLDRDEHTLSHSGDSDAQGIADFHVTRRFYMNELAYLIDRLKAIPEGDGTVFDNTLIYACTAMGKSNNHRADNAPVILAGNAGGAFETGRLLNYGGQNLAHNHALTSVCHAFGNMVDAYGTDQYGTGPLPGLFS